MEDIQKSNTDHESKEKIKLSILIAEDDPGIRMGLEIFLGDIYSSVESVENGRLLVERFSTPGHKIDVVLTDNNMPEMTGVEAIKKIHTIDPTISIIMLTADQGAEFESQKQKLESWGVVFLEKPLLGMNVLKKTIEKMTTKQT